MTYYVLRSLSAPLVAMITDDPISGKLPVDYGPWALHESSVALVSLAATPEHIAASVAEKGYYVVSVENVGTDVLFAAGPSANGSVNLLESYISLSPVKASDIQNYITTNNIPGLLRAIIGDQPETYIDQGSGAVFRFINDGVAVLANIPTGGSAGTLYTGKTANIFGSPGKSTQAITQALSSQVQISSSPLSNQAVITVNGVNSNITYFDTIADIDGRLTFGVNTSTAQVYRLYEAVLGRSPDALGLGTFSYEVTGGVPLNAVAQQLLGSGEFQNRYGTLSNPDFVTLTYQNILGRTPGQGEQAAWLNNLAAGESRADVEIGFITSAEAIAHTQTAVTAGLWAPDPNAVKALEFYQAALNRLPDKAGLVAWTQRLDAGLSVDSLANSFFGSTESQSAYGGLSDTAFVNQLYQQALGRAPDSTGQAAWVSRIQSGALTRAQVLEGFATSPELSQRLLPDYVAGIKTI